MPVAIDARRSADPPSCAVPTDPIWRLSVEQYHRMIDAGILDEDDPVELLEGWLVAKMTIGPPHNLAVELTRTALESVLPGGWFVNSQGPITSDESEPQPDVAVVRGERRQFHDRHAGPDDLAIVVEIADTSLPRDQGIKKRVYARAAIRIYWIVNLIEDVVEVYTDPSGPGERPDYRRKTTYGPDEEVPVVLDGREVGRFAVRDLLP